MSGTSLIVCLALGFGFASSTACGPTADEEMINDGFELLEPRLESVAPTALILGETVKVIGSDFILPEDGRMSLLLEGVYTDVQGGSNDFSGEIQLEVLNTSVAEFAFEEIFFHPSRDQIGTFRGTATLVSRAPSQDDLNAMDEMWSKQRDTDLRVEPSLYVSRLRSADDDSCAYVTSATNANQNLQIGFKALGLGEASVERPWKVRLTFVSPEVSVRYVVPDAFSFWPINGPLDDTVSTEVAAGTHRVEFDVDSGDNIIIDPTRTARRVRVSPPVTIGQNQYSEVVLGTLLAGAATEGGKSTANFVIEVLTEDGRALRRLVTMDLWSEIEIGLWSGAEKVVERYEPHAVSGCIPGGQVGGTLSYSEGESVTRTRSLDIKWNAQTSTSLGFSVGISPLSVSTEQGWSQSFGVDISEGVSSSTNSEQNISVQLLPTYFGMSYRQLERLERQVDVIYHNACGQSGVVGEAELTNWNFAFDVAQGPVCAPASGLPPAEVF